MRRDLARAETTKCREEEPLPRGRPSVVNTYNGVNSLSEATERKCATAAFSVPSNCTVLTADWGCNYPLLWPRSAWLFGSASITWTSRHKMKPSRRTRHLLCFIQRTQSHAVIFFAANMCLCAACNIDHQHRFILRVCCYFGHVIVEIAQEPGTLYQKMELTSSGV